MEFNVNTLKNLVKTTKPIGKGTSRKVVSIGNGLAVKVALNPKGIAQSMAEFDLHDEPYTNKFNKCIWMSEDGKYLVVEECKKVTHISQVKKWLETQEEIFEDVLQEMECSYGLAKGDLERPSSWGINSKGEYVLIDFGGTQEIIEKYYRRSWK